MKTISIGIQNLSAPCECTCKYCLLQSCKKAEGVDYFRGKKLAENFMVWAKERKISPLPYYCVGYCAEYPQLIDNIRFNIANGFIGSKFLQCNGIKIRTSEETDEFITKIMSAGVENIDITFYGSRVYHDWFSGRHGDYDFMLLLASRASALGLKCLPTVVITKENINMLDDLVRILYSFPNIKEIHSFLPDCRGRGYVLEQSRISADDYDSLSDSVKKTFNISRYKTQSNWLSCGNMPEYTKRTIIITLRKDNIKMLENMTCNEIIAYVEKLDEDYYKAIPPLNELARMYGDTKSEQLYRLRDLFWMWQKKYIKDNCKDIYDVTDERHCCTIRS